LQIETAIKEVMILW